MSELNLDAIEARANAATEGPWVMVTQGGIESEHYRGPGEDASSVAQTRTQGDWEFIAHARTDVPALVARVRELEAAVERVRAIEVADRVDHSQHVGAGGEPCGVSVSWKSRMGRDLANALEGATDDMA